MIVRSLLLFLSHQSHLRRWVENSPVAQKRTRRFVAGKTLEEGLAVCARLNSEGIVATLDHLGENVSSIEEGARTRDAYLEALRQISDLRLNSTVSLKLTHFGLDYSEEKCREYVADVVAEAARRGNSVEVDMESLNYVDATLRTVTELHERHGCVRAVIQAYLRRSEDDIRMLAARGIPVRLCKGAYKEPPEVAFLSKEDIDQNYLRLARLLLADGTNPAVATHDEQIIDQIVQVVAEQSLPPEGLEFQMLYGIRKPLQRRLAGEGFRVRLYVPYGVAWYPYFMRRLAENPKNLLLIIRNMFSR
jgi:proline dehydrogenase